MANPYKKVNQGAVSAKRGAQPEADWARNPHGSGWLFSLVKIFSATLVLAFICGMVISAVQTLQGIGDDASETALLVSLSVSRTLNTPAYWAMETFGLYGWKANALVTANVYAVTPYQTFAYAGAYAGNTLVQLLRTILPGWTFHF